jgi:uncharacterized protein YlaI
MAYLPHTFSVSALKRLCKAPNLALATLWADMLTQQGIEATVQRAYVSSIAGEIPPDQALPEIWVLDDEQVEAARLRLDELRHPPWRQWVCRSCLERIDGPFEQCWNCGAMRPW